MSELSAEVGLCDELSAALAAVRDAPPTLEVPDAGPVFDIASGDASVVLHPGESIMIGRAQSSNAVGIALLGVDHRTVSRRHVALHHTGTDLIAEDLGSRNGTTVTRGQNTSPLAGPTVLVEGDRLHTTGGIELARIVVKR